MPPDKAEETVVLNLKYEEDVSQIPAATAEIAGSLETVRAEAEKTKEVIRGMDAQAREMAMWLESMGQGEAAADMLRNLGMMGEEAAPQLEQVAEAEAQVAEQAAQVAETMPEAAAATATTATAMTEAEAEARKYQNALKMLEAGIKEYGVSGDAAIAMVEDLAEQEELGAEKAELLKRELGLVASSLGETSDAAKTGAGDLMDVADEGASALEIVRQAETALRSMRVGLGAVGADPALTEMVGSAMGLAGILDVIGPAIPLITNPVVVAAAASAGAFWMVHKETVGTAMEDLKRRRAWEAESMLGAAQQGKSFWFDMPTELGGEKVRIRPELATGYQPTENVRSLERHIRSQQERGFGPETQLLMLQEQRQAGNITEQEFHYLAMQLQGVRPGTTREDVQAEATRRANERARTQYMESIGRVAEEASWRGGRTQGVYWGGRTPQEAERGTQLRAWSIAQDIGVEGVPYYSQQEQEEWQREMERAQQDAARTQKAFQDAQDRWQRRQQEAYWERSIPLAPSGQQDALRQRRRWMEQRRETWESWQHLQELGQEAAGARQRAYGFTGRPVGVNILNWNEAPSAMVPQGRREQHRPEM